VCVSDFRWQCRRQKASDEKITCVLALVGSCISLPLKTSLNTVQMKPADVGWFDSAPSLPLPLLFSLLLLHIHFYLFCIYLDLFLPSSHLLCLVVASFALFHTHFPIGTLRIRPQSPVTAWTLCEVASAFELCFFLFVFFSKFVFLQNVRNHITRA
jgi:hypothetical protein